jgi:hypothetical protein
MNPLEDADGPIDMERLQEVLHIVHAQVAAALWLSAGMILAVGAVACIAFGFRRTALVCGMLYSATLCFVQNGHAQVLGPIGCAISAIGLAWPQKRRARA